MHICLLIALCWSCITLFQLTGCHPIIVTIWMFCAFPFTSNVHWVTLYFSADSVLSQSPNYVCTTFCFNGIYSNPMYLVRLHCLSHFNHTAVCVPMYHLVASFNYPKINTLNEWHHLVAFFRGWLLILVSAGLFHLIICIFVLWFECYFPNRME